MYASCRHWQQDMVLPLHWKSWCVAWVAPNCMPIWHWHHYHRVSRFGIHRSQRCWQRYMEFMALQYSKCIYIYTRWAPTSYKWSYNPYKWPYKWVTGVITPISEVITLLITGRGPTLYTDCSGVIQVLQTMLDQPAEQMRRVYTFDCPIWKAIHWKEFRTINCWWGVWGMLQGSVGKFLEFSWNFLLAGLLT